MTESPNNTFLRKFTCHKVAHDYTTQAQRRRCYGDKAERDLRMLALKIGDVWPQAKECQQPTSAGRGRSGFSLEPLEGAVDIFMFAWCQISDLQNCERRNVFILSH